MLAAACTGTVLAACGSHGHAPTNAGKTQHAAVHSAIRREGPDADMVAAVATSKTDSRVIVKFALRQKPQVGQPTEIDLALIPQMPLDRVVESFYAEDGVALREGADTITLDRPEPGTPVIHTLTVVPQRDGIFYVNATVLADSEAESVARIYSIPLIAGNGLMTPRPSAPASGTPATAAMGSQVARAPVVEDSR